MLMPSKCKAMSLSSIAVEKISMPRLQKCPCGSGEYPEGQYDARGIFLCYTCFKCEAVKLSGYRLDVLHNPNYECDEAIEGDY